MVKRDKEDRLRLEKDGTCRLINGEEKDEVKVILTTMNNDMAR